MATRKTVYDTIGKMLYCHNPSHCLVRKGGRHILFRVIRWGQNHATTGDKGKIVMFVSTDGGDTDTPPIDVYEDDKWDVRSPNISYDSGRDELIVTLNQTDQNVDPEAEKTDIIVLSIAVDAFLGDMRTAWTKRVVPSGYTSLAQTNGPMLVYRYDGTDYWGMPVYGQDSGDEIGTWRGKWLRSCDQYATAPSEVDVWSETPANEWVVQTLADGTLHGLVREESSRTIQYVRSSDGGATWGSPTDHSPVFTGSAAPYFCQLPNGSLVVTYRKWPAIDETGYRVSEPGNPLSWGSEGTVSPGAGTGNYATYCQPIADDSGQIYMIASEETDARAFSDVFARVAIESSQTLTFQEIGPACDDQSLTVSVAASDGTTLAADIGLAPSPVPAGTKALASQGATTTGATGSYPIGKDGDSTGHATTHFRHIVPASALPGGGERIRVKVARGSTEGMHLENIFIGQRAVSGKDYDFSDGFKGLTFGGSRRVVMSAESDEDLWSDWVDFAYDGTADLVIATSFARDAAMAATQQSLSVAAGYAEYSQNAEASTYFGGCQTPPGTFVGPITAKAMAVFDMEFADHPPATELDSGWFSLEARGAVDWATFRGPLGITALTKEDTTRIGPTPGFHLVGYKVYVNGGRMPVWGTDVYRPLWAVWDLADSEISNATSSVRVKCQVRAG